MFRTSRQKKARRREKFQSDDRHNYISDQIANRILDLIVRALTLVWQGFVTLAVTTFMLASLAVIYFIYDPSFGGLLDSAPAENGDRSNERPQ